MEQCSYCASRQALEIKHLWGTRARHASLWIKTHKVMRRIGAKRAEDFAGDQIQGLEAVHEPIECVGKLTTP